MTDMAGLSTRGFIASPPTWLRRLLRRVQNARVVPGGLDASFTDEVTSRKGRQLLLAGYFAGVVRATKKVNSGCFRDLSYHRP
jgi:hypothetical protein